MKFTVQMKDPDVLGDAIDAAVLADVAELGLNRREAEAVCEVRGEAMRKVCGTWFRHGEYLRIEIDTDAGTATVLAKDAP